MGEEEQVFFRGVAPDENEKRAQASILSTEAGRDLSLWPSLVHRVIGQLEIGRSLERWGWILKELGGGEVLGEVEYD